MVKIAETFKIRKARPKREVNNIEKALSSGATQGLDFIFNRAKKLNRNDIKTISILLNDPLERNDLKNLLYLMPFNKGWLVKESLKWFKPLTYALNSEYQNKRIRKALSKIQSKFGNQLF